jgi:hypothetical protein
MIDFVLLLHKLGSSESMKQGIFNYQKHQLPYLLLSSRELELISLLWALRRLPKTLGIALKQECLVWTQLHCSQNLILRGAGRWLYPGNMATSSITNSCKQEQLTDWSLSHWDIYRTLVPGEDGRMPWRTKPRIILVAMYNNKYGNNIELSHNLLAIVTAITLQEWPGSTRIGTR